MTEARCDHGGVVVVIFAENEWQVAGNYRAKQVWPQCMAGSRDGFVWRAGRWCRHGGPSRGCAGNIFWCASSQRLKKASAEMLVLQASMKPLQISAEPAEKRRLRNREISIGIVCCIIARRVCNGAHSCSEIKIADYTTNMLGKYVSRRERLRHGGV